MVHMFYERKIAYNEHTSYCVVAKIWSLLCYIVDISNIYERIVSAKSFVAGKSTSTRDERYVTLCILHIEEHIYPFEWQRIVKAIGWFHFLPWEYIWDYCVIIFVQTNKHRRIIYKTLALYSLRQSLHAHIPSGQILIRHNFGVLRYRAQ
jgi:hypothetical protein